LEDGELKDFVRQRYSSFDKGVGKQFASGKLTLADLSRIAGVSPEPEQISGRQEYIENLISRYV